MRSVFIGILPLAIAACDVENVSIDLPPEPPLKGSTAACSATPTALAHLPGIAPRALVMDTLNFYVVASAEEAGATQSIWRVPKDGSAPQRLATSETPILGLSRTAFAYPQATTVFWTTAGPDVDGGSTGAVLSVGLGAADKPVVLASNRRLSGPLIALDQGVLWAEQVVEPSGQLVEALVETSLTGGPITRLQTLDADHVPTAFRGYEQGMEVGGVSTTGEWLVWTTFSAHLGNAATAEIVECPLPAPFGPQTLLAGPDAGGVAGATLDPSATAIVYSGRGVITERTLPFDGGLGRTRPVATTAGFLDDVEDDGVDVYFVDPATERLMAVPRLHADAQAPRVVARSVDPATRFGVDDACVYWIDARAETITMVKK